MAALRAIRKVAMRDLVFRFIAATWLVCSVAAASAAEIRISDHPAYSIILEGTVVPGDYDKLRQLIDENCPSKSWNTSCPREIYLASPGGNVTEAIKIGRLVRTLRLGTQVPQDATADLRQAMLGALKLQDPKANYLCASACFFIAVAGIEREPTLEIEKPILGMHRPFMTDADLKTLSANQVIASASQVRIVVEAYLKEMGVPLKYADIMFSIPKDQIRWITIAEYQSDFAGVAPELKDWLSARCDKRTEVEKRVDELLDAKITRGEKLTPEEEVIWRALGEKLKGQVWCQEGLKDKMRADAWKAYRGL
jgi:hypothetical protein